MQEITHRPKIVRALIRFLDTVLAQAKFWLLLLIPVIVMTIAMLLAISINQPQDAIKVSLYERQDISPLQQFNKDAPSEPNNKLLRVAIAGVLSPSKTLESYQGLLNYMGQKLGQRVTMVLKPTYAEINDLIRGERVDLAIICSLAYIKGNQDFGMELLVVPQIHGDTVYYSYLIVARDSGSLSLKDLRGGSFAFTDPWSNSGHLVPTYQLLLLGETPASFFARYIYTYSHDNSIKIVPDKLVDGAAVDSLVYDRLVAKDPELASETKIIARWGPYGIPPIVIGPTVDPQLKQQLQDFFLDLHKSDEGMKILNNLSVDKFVLGADEDYDSIREMKAKLGW